MLPCCHGKNQATQQASPSSRPSLPLALEPHTVFPPVHHDGDHGQHIDEALAVLLEVDDFQLDLPPLFERLLHLPDGFLLDVAAGRPGVDLSVWGLEEPAVVAPDLVKGVAGHVGEGRRGVDDGLVWQCHVAENEGAGVVDGAEIYPGVWSEADGSLGKVSKQSAWVRVAEEADQNLHQIVPSWGVQAVVEEGRLRVDEAVGWILLQSHPRVSKKPLACQEKAGAQVPQWPQTPRCS